jgi:hypothetical protein
MRKAFKHVGVLMMTAVVGLSVIGAAYALWFEDLKFQAQVATGTFDVDWSFEGARPVVAIIEPGEEPELDNIDSYLIGNQIPAGKAPSCGPATAETAIADLQTNPYDGFADMANDEADDNWLRLWGDNLYPFAGCIWDINIHNQGSVPAHIQIKSVLVQCAELPETYLPWLIEGDDDLPGTFPIGSGPELPPNLGLEPCDDDEVADSPFIFRVVSGEWDGTYDEDPGTPGRTAQAACELLFGTPQPGGTLEFGNGQPLQLHQSNELHCRLAVVLDQDADAEGIWFNGVVIFRAHQWNEDQTAP